MRWEKADIPQQFADSVHIAWYYVDEQTHHYWALLWGVANIHRTRIVYHLVDGAVINLEADTMQKAKEHVERMMSEGRLKAIPGPSTVMWKQ